MNVYQKLNAAREEFHTLKLTKTGHNKFAGYYYFELGDFLIPAMRVFGKHGLCALPVTFTNDVASMTIVNAEKPDEKITFESPMGSAALKGCHEVQNIGAVETYQRRYLWVAALEIVEHDALDATTGKSAPESPPSSPDIITEEQWEELSALADKAGVSSTIICKAEKCDSLRELPASRLAGLTKRLNATINKNKQQQEERKAA